MPNGRLALSAVWGWLKHEPVLLLLIGALIALQLVVPQPAGVLLARIDGPTVATLAGLLMLTRALELSGFLSWLAQRIVANVHSERALALLLLGFAAFLSMWVTNDVALFVVIPLLVSLRALAPLPFKRLVIFSALAVNAGAIATPFGNPQNLFLWQVSGVSFGRFVIALGPLALLLTGLLLALTACAFRGRALDLSRAREAVPQHVAWPRAALAALLFAGFVWLADTHRAWPALLLVSVCLLPIERTAVYRIDIPLLAIFVLMFIVLRGAAALPFVHDALVRWPLSDPMRVYLAGAAVSQAVSNVPATILLASFTPDWRALGFGVSVGGFGCAIGSLANLIAVRLARSKGLWLPFHLVSIPFGLVSLLLGAWLLPR